MKVEGPFPSSSKMRFCCEWGPDFVFLLSFSQSDTKKGGETSQTFRRPKKMPPFSFSRQQLPYYAYLYQKEDADFAAAPPPPPDSVAVGGPASAAEAASAPQQPPPPALPPPPQSSQQVVSSMVRAQSGNRYFDPQGPCCIT